MTVPNTSTSATPLDATGIAQFLDDVANLVDLARNDANQALRELPRHAPLFAVVDLVSALAHMRQAAVLVDRCADALERAEVIR